MLNPRSPIALSPERKAQLRTVLRGQSSVAVLARGASTTFIVSVMGTALGLLLNVVLARGLGVDSYGEYVYAVSWLQLLMIFATLGLPSTFVRFMPQYRVREEWDLYRGLLHRTLRLIAAASILAAVAVASIAWIARDQLGTSLAVTFMVGALFLPASALQSRLGSMMTALKQFGWLNVQSLLAPIVFVTMIVTASLVLGDRMSASVAIGLNVLNVTLVGLFSYVVVRHRHPPQAQTATPRYETRQWFRVAVPLIVTQELALALERTDILLLGAMSGTGAAGIYAVASRLSRLPAFGLRATDHVSSPLIAELYHGERREELQRIVTLSAWAATGTALAIVVPLVIGHRLFLGLLGHEFLVATSPLLILLIASLSDAMTGPSGPLLTLTGHHDDNLKLVAVAALCNGMLNYPAIQLWGISGAAIATAVVIAGKNVVTSYVAFRRTGVNSSVFASPQPVIEVLRSLRGQPRS